MNVAEPRARYSGAAVLGLAAVILGFLLLPVAVAPVLLGLVGIVAGRRSRAQLRSDPALRGSFASLAGFVGGVLLVGSAAATLILPAAVIVFGSA